MKGQRRRTEIQIETREVTIIRFGRVVPIDPEEESSAVAEVLAHSDNNSTQAEDKKEDNDEQQD